MNRTAPSEPVRRAKIVASLRYIVVLMDSFLGSCSPRHVSACRRLASRARLASQKSDATQTLSTSSIPAFGVDPYVDIAIKIIGALQSSSTNLEPPPIAGSDHPHPSTSHSSSAPHPRSLGCVSKGGQSNNSNVPGSGWEPGKLLSLCSAGTTVRCASGKV